LAKASSITLTSVKFIYLGLFFALLSGIFHPLIEGGSFEQVITGILVLFVGLAGALLLYKAGTTGKKRGIYLGSGFGILTITLILVFSVAGRI